MVVPTSRHADVTRWLDAHGCPTSELAFMLLCQDPVALLEAVRVPVETTPEEQDLLRLARAHRGKPHALEPGVDRSPEAARMRALLTRLGSLLAGVGVRAEPYEGLGVVFGDEIHSGMLLVPEPDDLRERIATL